MTWLRLSVAFLLGMALSMGSALEAIKRVRPELQLSLKRAYVSGFIAGVELGDEASDEEGETPNLDTQFREADI